MNQLQFQFLAFALGGGLVLVISMALTYLALWRPRETEQLPQGFKGLMKSFPIILIFTISSFLLYGIVHVYFNIMNPPTF